MWVRVQYGPTTGPPAPAERSPPPSAKTSNGIEGDVVEAVTSVAASTGNIFRHDARSDQYVSNWSTKGLTRGTYLIRVDLGDTATGERFAA